MIKQLVKTTLVLTLVAGFGATANAQEASANYYSLTGELEVEIGNRIAIVGFETADLFITAPSSFQDDPAQFDSKILAFFTTDTAGLPVGKFNLGRLLPTGLTADDIKFGYSPVGQPNVPTPVNVIVPEPSTMTLIVGLGAIGFVSRRR